MPPERKQPGPLPTPEADALPEHTAYADTGCDVFDRRQFPSCLACPLPACIHDSRPDRRALRALTAQRRQIVGELARRGRTTQQIARTLKISRRTVLRDLRAGEEERTQPPPLP